MGSDSPFGEPFYGGQADARKRAEEALARWGLCDPSRYHDLHSELEGVYRCADDLASALRALLAEQRAGGAETERLRSAILWALGVNGEFPPRDAGQGAYYWRRELAERAGIDMNTPLAPPPAPTKAEQDGAGAKLDDCLCHCPETPGTHTATRCWDPAPSPASDEVREALAEIVEWAASEGPCSCTVDSPVQCWLCRCHGRATAALAARPAAAKGDEVRETVLGTCEMCRASRRRVHREPPNRFVECHGAGFVWLCKRCGRWNTAINNGKAICCTDPCERGGE